MIKRLFLITLLLSLCLCLRSYSATEFVCAINKTGEDYNTLSSWEAAIDDCGDITVSTTKVFSHSGITGSIADGASVIGATSGATGTVAHCTSSQILIYNISGTFQSGEQVRVDASNYVTISDAGDNPIIVAECYDDDGDLDDAVIIDGLTTSSTNYMKITAPEGERHNGTVSSGFKISTTTLNNAIVWMKDDYIIVEWIIITGETDYSIGIQAESSSNSIGRNIIVYNITTSNYTRGSIRSYVAEVTYYNCISYNNVGAGFQSGYNGTMNVYNCTSYNNSTYGFDGHLCKNCASFNNTTADFNSLITGSDYNCSSDDTADDVGSNNFINKSASNNFVNITSGSEDLHLKNGADCIDAGTTLTDFSNDIDDDTRPSGSAWDIGADEYISSGGGGNSQVIFMTKKFEKEWGMIDER